MGEGIFTDGDGDIAMTVNGPAAKPNRIKTKTNNFRIKRQTVTDYDGDGMSYKIDTLQQEVVETDEIFTVPGNGGNPVSEWVDVPVVEV